MTDLSEAGAGGSFYLYLPFLACTDKVVTKLVPKVFLFLCEIHAINRKRFTFWKHRDSYGAQA